MKKTLLTLVVCMTFMFAGIKSCQAQIVHSGTNNWTASATSGATYSLYRATATKNSDGSFTPGTFALIKSGIAALTFVDSGLAGNTSYCYQLTATATGFSESSPVGGQANCGTTGIDQTAPPGAFTTIFK